MGNTDSMPAVSQVKSGFQLVCGDVKGAAKTQKNFLRECPGVSQVTSTVQFLTGDRDGALETQKRCGKNLLNIIDGTPAVGHVKGLIHYACGDKEGGNKAMKSASRTTGALIGGAGGFMIGGPVGAVVGGVSGAGTLDAVTTLIDSTIHDEFRPSGYIAGINNAVNNPNAGNIFDLAFMPVADGLAGYGAGKMVNSMKNSAVSNRVNAQVLEARAQAPICVPNRTYMEQRAASTSTGSSTSSISTVQVSVTATTSGNKSTSASGKGSEGTGSTGVNGGSGDDERGSGWKNPACDGEPPCEDEISTSNDIRIALLTKNLPRTSTLRNVTDRGPVMQVATRIVNGSTIVDYVRANIQHEHLRTGTAITDRARKEIQRLGMTVAGRVDDAGHILASVLGGHLEENLFPQNPSMNRGFFRNDFEALVQRFLTRHRKRNARVDYQVRLLYNANQTRPYGLYILVRYYIGDRLARADELYEESESVGIENPLFEWMYNPEPNDRYTD